MAEYQYLTLLRGINVGGNNIIRMTDLKSCFEEIKFSGVVTYIQSGNVLFSSGDHDITALTDRIEKVLSERFNYNSRIVLVTRPQLEKAVLEAPAGFGKEPEIYRYDVLFVKDPLTPVEMMKSVTVRPGVDYARAGDSVVYFSRLISKASLSHLRKIIQLPVYQNITIRNWNTTTKLLEMMES